MKKRLLKTAAAAALLSGAGCIDFQQSRESFCTTVSARLRAEICEDGPQCVTRDPPPNTTGVALDQKPGVTFDKNVTCPVNGLRMVQNTVGEPVVAGTTACSAARAIFTPSSPLLNGRVYKVYIEETIVDEAGTPALCTPWTFTSR